MSNPDYESLEQFYLDNIIDEVNKKAQTNPSLDYTKLSKGDLIVVETLNSKYLVAIEAIEDSSALVAIKGGEFLPGLCYARLYGCNFGGSVPQPGLLIEDARLDAFIFSQRDTISTTIIILLYVERNSPLAWQMLDQCDRSFMVR